jgi:hypothetical protein
MKMELRLPSGHIVLIDNEDYEKLKRYKYYLHKKGYVYRFDYENKRKVIYLHREIMGFPEGKVIDHINRNKLDNRKRNLRIATNKQNLHNSEKSKAKSTSKYKGVCWIKKAKAWQATITIDGKQHKIGYFHDENVAAVAYNHYAKMYRKEFAFLNDVIDTEWESKLIPNRRDGTGKSKYIGVSYRPKYNDWQVTISSNYKSYGLGTFKDEIEAAESYNAKAIELHGERAKLNILD